MNRTAEFRSLLKLSEREDEQTNQEKFYESLYKSIAEASEQVTLAGSYKSLLVLEEKVEDLRKKTNLLLSAIEVKGPEDVQMHFEGVKYIINSAIIGAAKTIASAKNKMTGAKVDLVPEQSGAFKKSQGTDLEMACEKSNVVYQKTQQDQILERENKEIVENTQYEITRQRLLKIEVVQKAIQESLALQDERIDSICIANDTTGKIYRSLSTGGGFERGSLIRRALFVMIMCSTCVLIFLHLYYR